MEPTIVSSQISAALKMLRSAIEACPEEKPICTIFALSSTMQGNYRSGCGKQPVLALAGFTTIPRLTLFAGGCQT